MKKGKHHFLLDPFFRHYVIWKMHRNFHSVVIKGQVIDRNLPVLLICNHISWWDGIWAYNVNKTLFKRTYYFMMLEEQLRKNWFLNGAGGYSLPGNSRGKAESVNYTANLLKNPGNLVLIFPQGEIESMHKQTVIFKKGVAHILQRLENEVQVIFLVNLMDYHAHVKPTVYSFIGEYTGGNRLADIEGEYNRFYLDCSSELKEVIV